MYHYLWKQLQTKSQLFILFYMPVQSMFIVSWITYYKKWTTVFIHILEFKRISKTCKKLKSYDGSLRYLQDSTANPAHLSALFCPVLVRLQQATTVNKSKGYFCNYSSSRHKKHFQMLKRLFVVFFCSIKIMWPILCWRT